MILCSTYRVSEILHANYEKYMHFKSIMLVITVPVDKAEIFLKAWVIFASMAPAALCSRNSSASFPRKHLFLHNVILGSLIN